MRRFLEFALLAGLVAVVASGCGGSSEPPSSSMIPVSGRVTHKGQVLTQGTVKFEPEDAGREAFGDIKPDGTYTLTTFATNDGAIKGLHRVSVTGAKVPAKYKSAASSKIEVEVVPGKNDYPIDLP